MSHALIKDFARRLRRDYSNVEDDVTARTVLTSVTADLLTEKYPLLAAYYNNKPTKKLQQVSGYYSVIDGLAELDSITAAYQLSSFYSLLICQDRRYRDGIYFTPPSLSRRVLQEVAGAFSGDLLSARILDPCSGGGAFLAPTAAYLREEMKSRGIRPSHRLNRISKNIFGVDVCETLNELSRIFCLIELYSDIEWEQFVPRIQIETRNFLTNSNEQQHFDVVIGNPPFRRLSSSETISYAQEFGATNNGGSNLYGLFIQQSINLVRPGGVVGLIIPASLFAGARFAQLRSFIGSSADVISVQTMQEREGIFMDVQQEAAVLTLRKVRPKVRRRKLSRVSTVCGKVKSLPIGKCELPRDSRPWVIPRNRDQLDAAALFSRNLPRLEDYGVAIHTGTVVWNRDKRPRYAHRGRETQVNKRRFPLIWSDCIGADGSFSFGRAIERSPKEIFVGTKATDPELLRSSAIAVKRTSNSKQARRIYCAFISKSFVSTYGAYLGENHINVLLPRNAKSTLNLAVLAQVLNTEAVDEAFRCLSGSTAVSKYELSRLPLPDLEYVQRRMTEGFTIGAAVRLGFYE